MVLLIVCMGVGLDWYMTTSAPLDTGVDDFGAVQFRHTCYMPIQPVVYYFSTIGWTTSAQFLDHFGT